MSQNSLIEKIKQDVAQVVADIEAASAAEIETIAHEVEAAKADLKSKHEVTAKKQLHHQEVVALSRAKQAGTIALQVAKRNEMDAVFSAVKEKISSLTSEEYVALCVSYATSIMAEKPTVTKIISPSTRTSETKEILSALHIDGPIEVEREITAGIIVHAEDGVYDASLDRLIFERRPELEIELMKRIEV